MSMNMHIEILVLDGVPVDKLHQSSVSESIESELVNLLLENGSFSSSQTDGSIHLIRGSDIAIETIQEPARLGQKIAGEIYRGIKP